MNNSEEVSKDIGINVLKYLFVTLVAALMIFSLWDITIGPIFSLNSIGFVQAVFLKMIVDFIKM